MDRQAESRSGGVPESSGRVNFKYLLLSYVIFLGFHLLRSVIAYVSSGSPLWYELCYDYDRDNYGIGKSLLYSLVLGDLQCLLTAPLCMTAASLVYRALNGMGAKNIGGFFRINVWLRSAAVYLPIMMMYSFFYNSFLFIGLLIGNEFLLLPVTYLLQAIFGCVYYGFAACDPMKNITLGQVYKAGLKKAVRRPVRLIITAALIAAAYYLLFTLPLTALNNAVLWQGPSAFYFNAQKPVLDYRIGRAIGLILSPLVLLVQSLIFYLVMLPRKKIPKAAENND